MRNRKSIRRHLTLNQKSSKTSRTSKTASSIVLGRPSPCDVPKGYDSVAGLPAALLEDCFEHPLGRIVSRGLLSLLSILFFERGVKERVIDDYLVSSLTRWPSSGRMSFSIARRTAFSEPGVEKRTRPLMMPAVARLMMAGEPIS
jgi:hypothetical protein